MTPDLGEQSDRLVIYPSRAKMALVLLGSVAFVVIGIWIGTPDVARGLASWKVVIASYVVGSVLPQNGATNEFVTTKGH